MTNRLALTSVLAALAAAPALGQNLAPPPDTRSAIPYKMILEGRSAVDVAKQICAVYTNCADHVANGPGPGQTTHMLAIDVSTAKYVSEKPGDVWGNQRDSLPTAIVRVSEAGGVLHHFIIGDRGGITFPGPWIHAFDNLKPVSPQP